MTGEVVTIDGRFAGQPGIVLHVWSTSQTWPPGVASVGPSAYVEAANSAGPSYGVGPVVGIAAISGRGRRSSEQNTGETPSLPTPSRLSAESDVESPVSESPPAQHTSSRWSPSASIANSCGPRGGKLTGTGH